MNMKTRAVVVGAAAAAVAVGGGTAYAVGGGYSGGAVTQKLVRTETDANIFSSSSYVDIPGSGLLVRIPRRQSRLVTARFTAESACTGTSGWCSIRLVAVNPVTGAILELNPQSGLDFAFDSVSTDLWESHSVARVARLGAGTWVLRVQGATIGTGTTERYDDWTFEVDVNR